MIDVVPSFREDVMATYYYYADTNEVEVLFKKKLAVIEASVLVEMLAGAIIDVSHVQSSDKKEEG